MSPASGAVFAPPADPAPSPPARPFARRLLPWLLLVLIVAGAGALRAYAFAGIVREDSFHYLEMSHHFLVTGELFPQLGSFATTRMTIVMPSILANLFFGYGEPASIAWPFLCSLGTVVLAFLIGRKLGGSSAGVIAAAIVAVAPIEAELGTMLLPDPIVGFFIALAFWLALEAADLRGWEADAALVASGVALGAAYFARVNALAFLPLVMLVPLVPKAGRPRPAWRALLPLVGALGVLGGAAVVFWLSKGDPLYDWHRSLTVYANLGYQDLPPEVRYSRTGDAGSYLEMLFTWPAFMWLAIAGTLSAIWAYAAKKRDAALPILWALGFYVYIEFVSPLHHLAVRDRYLEPIILPLAILVAMLIASLKPRTLRALAAVAMVAFVAVSASTALSDNAKWRQSSRYLGPRMLAARLQVSDPRPVYVQSPKAFFAINYYTAFRYGYDPLAPGGGAQRRIFYLGDTVGRPWAAGPALFVMNGGQQPPAGGTMEAWAPYPEGRRLALWSFQPSPASAVGP